MCEICNDKEYVFENNFVQDNKNKKITFYPSSSWECISSLHISYCSMCGKKLGGEK